MKLTYVLGVVVSGFLISAGPSAAVQLVCPSTIAEPCEMTLADAVGAIDVDLFVHGGSNGVDVTITVANGFFSNFQQASAGDFVRFHPTDFSSETVREIRIAGVRENPVDPPDPFAPFHVGVLSVNTDASSTSASVAVAAGGKSVGAGDELEDISAQPILTILVPEPAEWLLLSAGALTLAALRRIAPRGPRPAA